MANVKECVRSQIRGSVAKIASGWKKPNGQFVIQPHEVQAFLLPLPVGPIPGVGKVTEQGQPIVASEDEFANRISGNAQGLI